MVKENKENKNMSEKLRVAEDLQDDVYKGIARVDSEIMRKLGIRRRDFVIIKGQRETIAIADRSYPADVGEGIIRMDGILRRNAKTGVGENIVLKRVELKEAKKVLIAPLAGELVITRSRFAQLGVNFNKEIIRQKEIVTKISEVLIFIEEVKKEIQNSGYKENELLKINNIISIRGPNSVANVVSYIS